MKTGDRQKKFAFLAFLIIVLVLAIIVVSGGIDLKKSIRSQVSAEYDSETYGGEASGEGIPILRIVPEQSNWIADGVTQYKLTVIGDSRPMNPSGTRIIEFGYFLPEAIGYTFNLVEVTMIPQNDFFTGWSTYNNHANGIVGRALSTSGTGPINREGEVVYMWFTVSKTGAGPENIQTSLGIDPDPAVTYFKRPTSEGGSISPTVESAQFYVMTEAYALASTCRSSFDEPAAC
ncbi:MAG: hypothetical protein AABX12_04640 [Nanoarchaeota archaeon]